MSTFPALAGSIWAIFLVLGVPPAAAPRPPIALLYHTDPDVRTGTLQALAATRDLGLIDDLIRAHAVEYYTPVHNAYFNALQAMTGQRAVRGPEAWKAWLNREAAAGRLTIDYLPLELDALPPDQRAKIQPLAAHLGPEHFNRMVRDLTTKGQDLPTRSAALRYMVANDHRDDVQKFLKSDWLVKFLAQDDLSAPMINDLAYVLSGLANPGPLRERINAQLRECLGLQGPNRTGQRPPRAGRRRRVFNLVRRARRGRQGAPACRSPRPARLGPGAPSDEPGRSRLGRQPGLL